MSHADLVGSELHSFVHYWQESDPGAVGARKTWFKESTRELFCRNDTDTGWITILASSNALALPPGSDWDDFVAAYNAANAGDTIYLPNEMITPTTGLEINKNIRILGTGTNSGFHCIGDYSISGSSLFLKFVSTTMVELAYFTIDNDRNLMNRNQAISITWNVHNIHIHHLTFNNITSNCINVQAEFETNGYHTTNICVHDCTATEWYESFFIIAGGDVYDVNVYNNTGSVSSGHPSGSVSSPYGIGVDIEGQYGLVENVLFENNTFTSTAWGGNVGIGNPSIGLFCTWSSFPPDDNLQYNNIVFLNNTVSGWTLNTEYRSQNRRYTGKTIVAFIGNNLSIPAYNWGMHIMPCDSRNAGDYLILARNISSAPSGKDGIYIDTSILEQYELEGPTITQIDNEEPVES